MNKSRLYALFLLLVMVSTWAFYLRPVRAQIKDLTSDIAKSEDVLQNLTYEYSRLQAIEETLPASDDSKKMLLYQIPDALAEEKLLRYIESAARHFGISFRNINFVLSENTSLEGIGSVTIAATFEGNDDDMLRFLASLERGTRFIRILSMSLQLSERFSTANLRMEAYYQD
jgi:Tfp pilus assembly protein PilO